MAKRQRSGPGGFAHEAKVGPEQFHLLFGYGLGNRDDIDNWHQIPARLRRSVAHQIAPVRSGSGVIEKNNEVQIARRFKHQGRSWTRPGVEHLA